MKLKGRTVYRVENEELLLQYHVIIKPIERLHEQTDLDSKMESDQVQHEIGASEQMEGSTYVLTSVILWKESVP